MQNFYSFITAQLTNIYNFYMNSWWLQVLLLIGVFNLVITLVKSLNNND